MRSTYWRGTFALASRSLPQLLSSEATGSGAWARPARFRPGPLALEGAAGGGARQHAGSKHWDRRLRSRLPRRIAAGRPGLPPNVARLGSTCTLMWAGGAAPDRNG